MAPVYVRGVPIKIPVSVGELVDRITILRLKAARIEDPAKLANVRSELAALEEIFERDVGQVDEVSETIGRLAEVNERLWEIEDGLRSLDEAQDFGDRFVQTARRVYQLNDLRFRLKREISEAHGSDVIEEKHYRSDG